MEGRIHKESIGERVVAKATPRAVLAAVGLYLASLVALQVADRNIANYAPGFSKPDLRFGYDYAEIAQALESLGEGGRRAYALSTMVDTVMPVLFATATVLVVARAVPRRLGLLSAAPIMFAVLDVVENASFGVMLSQYPDIAPALVAATSPVTMVKLAAYAVALPTLVLGVAALGVRWLREGRRDRVRLGP